MEIFKNELKTITLTNREKDVLSFVSIGLSSKEIASELSISKRTVDKHISNICLKFGAQNRAQAVAIAIKDNHINHK